MVNRKQHIPDIDFERFAFGDIKRLFDEDKIFINLDYQRGDIWTPNQQLALIESIINSYSIGVLVLYINEKSKFEILDGQQRLITIRKYLNGELNVASFNIQAYDELNNTERMFLDAYSVGYLKLKSHNQETKEEDIVQTFLRLQEGSPLNKAEKINAYRGAFKDTFKKVREDLGLFTFLGNDKRFRLRLLSAELLHLELESDFTHSKFPGLELKSLLQSCEKYKDAKKLSVSKIKFFKGNLEYLKDSLNLLLTGITPREIIPFYLLVSYLRKNKAGNKTLNNELTAFFKNFLQKLNGFSIYDTVPPSGMKKQDFVDFLEYKKQARKATSSDSIEFRFNFLKKKFKELHPYIKKDPKRLHDIEQKRILFFKQKGKCSECGKSIDFNKDKSAHHKIAHKDGGITDELKNAVLLHERCHSKLEKKIKKQPQ